MPRSVSIRWNGAPVIVTLFKLRSVEIDWTCFSSDRRQLRTHSKERNSFLLPESHRVLKSYSSSLLKSDSQFTISIKLIESICFLWAVKQSPNHQFTCAPSLFGLSGIIIIVWCRNLIDSINYTNRKSSPFSVWVRSQPSLLTERLCYKS